MRFRDYEEFLESLNAHGVRYLIVGGHAVAFHARPRTTKDLDLFLDPSVENAKRTLAAIRDFLGSDIGITVKDLTAPDTIVQLGVAPSRIDLAKLEGVPSFPTAWKSRVKGRFSDVSTQYLSLDLLIQGKEALGRQGSGRRKDSSDGKKTHERMIDS